MGCRGRLGSILRRQRHFYKNCICENYNSLMAKESHMKEYLENQLSKSVVYQQLKDNCEKNNQHEVLALVSEGGIFAVERLKTVIKNMPEFTLHD